MFSVAFISAVLAPCAFLAPEVRADDHTAFSQEDLDFIPESVARLAFDAEDFVLKFVEPSSMGPGGELRPQFVSQKPALATLPGEGVGQNLILLEPCAINQPHHHPRGTEYSHLLTGQLTFAFLEENGPNQRLLSTTLDVGETIVVPQGLIHFGHNKGCEPASFLASFPSRDPATITTGASLFRLPFESIQATIPGLDESTLKKVQDAVLNSGNPSIDPVCAKRCGLDGYGTYGEN